jgi:peptide/nickel transport system substrate-binding protein
VIASIAGACALLALGCVARRAALPYPPGPTAAIGPRSGGHAIFVREEDPDYLDPALSYGTYSAPMTEGLFHTLVDYAHAAGKAGAALSPDLAENLPAIREDGTLYCFRIRKDARFGSPLHRHITAADFKYAIERLFRVNSPGVNFYRHILGAEDVLAGRTRELVGVIARGDSLYIKIEQADATFLDILAMTFTAPVAREIAEKYPTTMSQHTVSTGPFEVAEFTPRRRVLMVRNPDYCGTPAWLDTFEIRLGVTSSNAVAMIRRGLVDGGFFAVPPADYARLKSDPYWTQQVDLADGLNTEYLWFNTRKKPFNDPRVRQAVAWALDRRAVLKVYAGQGVTAGEFLPPGMPGVQRLDRYQGPDLARSRRLLREAGYPNGFATRLYGWVTQPGPRELTIIQQQLAEVGIRATLDLSEAVSYTSFAEDTSRHVTFGIYAWTADYIDPSNFFDTLLNGHRIAAIHNENLSLFEDPITTASIERAMTIRDPVERARVWRQVDERVMDLAPVAPLIHMYESRLYGPRVGGWYRHITRLLKLEDLYLKAPAPA